MAVLAIEADPRQASALRHIVCDLLKSRLTLVDSIAGAVDAMSAETPDLILLPPIISPGDEAELLRALRRLLQRLPRYVMRKSSFTFAITCGA